MHGFGLILGHLVGDYLFQNDWQAANKKGSHLACLLHCCLYTLAVLLCNFWWLPWWAYPVVLALHFPVDRWHVVEPFMKVMGQAQFADKLKPWSVIMVDNVFHLLVLFVVGLFAEGSQPTFPDTMAVLAVAVLASINACGWARFIAVTRLHRQLTTSLPQACSFSWREEVEAMKREQQFQAKFQAEFQAEMEQAARSECPEDAGHEGFVLDTPLQADGRRRLVVPFLPGDTRASILGRLMDLLGGLPLDVEQCTAVYDSLKARLGYGFDKLDLTEKLARMDHLFGPPSPLPKEP